MALKVVMSRSIVFMKQSLSRSSSVIPPTPSFLCRSPLSLVSSSSMYIFSPTADHIFRSFGTASSKTSIIDNNDILEEDGLDYEHWMVRVGTIKDELITISREEIIDRYIKILTQVVGSEDEARKRIYSVSTKHYFGFGAILSEELSKKLQELPQVTVVLPDVYEDAANKLYAGEPFIDGKAVPYDPKYHEAFLKATNIIYGVRPRPRPRPIPRQNSRVQDCMSYEDYQRLYPREN